MSAELSHSIRIDPAAPLRAADIDDAARRISGVVSKTPPAVERAVVGHHRRAGLPQARGPAGGPVLQAAWCLQPADATEPDEKAAGGVVCSSAGNHAQGFALACRSMGIHGRVYVPAKTPKQKRNRIRYHGGDFIELIVGGKTYDMAAQAALDDVARTGATLVPPYDDVRTMAGQGTIAVEILDQLGAEPDLVIVPVGGGVGASAA